MEPKKRVPIDLTEENHNALRRLARKRSYELGRLVSMGFVVEEMIAREAQLEKGVPSAELFAAHD
jgi:hypothetical protein